MKKTIISSLLAVFVGCGLGAFAMITSDYTTSEQYLLNSNYSPEMVRMVNTRKVDPYAPIEEERVNLNPFHYVKRFWNYMDPASESGRFGHGIIDPRADRPSQL